MVVGVMLALIGAGSVILQREVASTATAALLLSVAWAGLVALGFLLYARQRDLLRPVLGGLAVGAVIGGASFFWFSVRDREVNEDVVVATEVATGAAAEQALAGSEEPTAEAAAPKPAAPKSVTVATGDFIGVDGHDGRGKATVVESGGKRTLTFTDFDVDPGPGIEVWLTTGPNETSDRIELGSLKGNVGNQQYEVPSNADLRRYGTVVLYCTPFTVRVAVAPLNPAS